MLARLQQALCLTLILIALGWLAVFWGHAPVLAVAGAVILLGGHALILACEFLLLHWIHRRDANARSTGVQMWRAWLGEVLVDVVVFFWRQPFRSHAVPDYLPPGTSARGVIFLHGLFCNRGFWAPWMIQARQLNKPCAAITLEPVLGSIDEYVGAIESAVQRMRQLTGQAPILVCHSMGGLAARAWLRREGAHREVSRIITIGTPHAGTWMARFGHGRSGVQMRLGSDWLRALGCQESPEHRALFTCWYSNCDNIVFPMMTATLSGADNRLLRGTAHVALAFHPTVMAESLAMI